MIHLAFANDFSSPEALADAVAEESAGLAALGEALVGSDRPFVACSGTPAVPGRASTEADSIPTEGPVGGRGRAVAGVLGLASRGVRSSAVRLPRTVHNEGTGGFAGVLTGIARQSGVSGYPGDGTQRWPAVHALDAAVLFRLALEQAQAGTSWHAVGDEGDQVRDIAAVIGRRLGLPVESVPVETYGPLGVIFAADQPSSSTHTRQALGWEPKHMCIRDRVRSARSRPRSRPILRLVSLRRGQLVMKIVEWEGELRELVCRTGGRSGAHRACLQSRSSMWWLDEAIAGQQRAGLLDVPQHR